MSDKPPITNTEMRVAGGAMLVLLAANPAVQMFKPDEEPRTITLQLDAIRRDVQFGNDSNSKDIAGVKDSVREVKGLVDGWRSEVALLNQRLNTHENWIRSRTDPTEGTMMLRIKALEERKP